MHNILQNYYVFENCRFLKPFHKKTKAEFDPLVLIINKFAI